jgi:hypothetical protein
MTFRSEAFVTEIDDSKLMGDSLKKEIQRRPSAAARDQHSAAKKEVT